MRTLTISFCLFTQLLSAQQSQICFLENRGQIQNQNGNSNDTVLYLFPAPLAYNVQLKQNGFAYDFYKQDLDTVFFESGLDRFPSQQITTHRIDVDFVNHHAATIVPLSPKSDYFNFVQVTDSLLVTSQVKHFERIKYENLYSDIDLVFEVINQKVKYNFIVYPGGNLSDIRLKFKGYNTAHFLDSVLQFQFDFGQNNETIPLSYYNDTSQVVDIRYRLLDSTNNELLIGFEFADTNQIQANDTLVIDPEPDLKWAAYMGNAFNNVNNSVITSKNGEVYTGGSSVNLISYASDGAAIHQLGNKTYDAFYSKINRDGYLNWTTFYQTADIELGESVQVDTMLNNYLLGTSLKRDSIFPDSLPYHKEIFVLKANRYGELIYFQKLENSAAEYAVEAITDFTGNIYLSSTADSLIGVDSVQQLIQIRAFSPSGILKWKQQLDGNGDDLATGISFGDHHVMVSGITNSTSGIASSSAFQTTLAGTQDGLLCSLDSLGNLNWSTYFGGDSIDGINGLKAFNDAIFIVGKTNSPNAIATPMAFQDSLKGGTDGFVARFSNTGNLEWGTYLGAETDDELLSISRELDSNIFVLGKTNSLDTLSTNNVYQQANHGATDCFITKFDPFGQRIWTSYYGGEGSEEPKAIHVFGNTSIYLVGGTNSPQQLLNSNNLHFGNESLGNQDGFIAKLTQDKSTIFSSGSVSGTGTCSGTGSYFGGTSTDGSLPSFICEGDSIHLTFTEGELGTDAEWVWYLNDCGNDAPQIGVGESIWFVANETSTVYVRAESISNSSPCVLDCFTVHSKPTAVITGDSVFCSGQDLTLSTSAYDSIVWRKNSAFLDTGQILLLEHVDSLDAGSYQLQVFTQYGCWDTTQVNVRINPSPEFSFLVQNASCYDSNNGAITVTLEHPTDSLVWSGINPSNDLSPDSLNAGTYLLHVINEFSCEIDSAIVLSSLPAASFDTLITPNQCGFSNGSIELIPNGPVVDFEFIWTDFEDSDSKLEQLTNGEYHLTVSDSNGCSYPFDLTVPTTDSLNLEIQPADTSVYVGDTLVLHVVAHFPDSTVTYLWESFGSMSCLNCDSTTIVPTEDHFYSVLASFPMGCIGSAGSMVHVLPIDTLISNSPVPGCIEPFIPDHFSPNGDGLNDTWCIIGTCIDQFTIQVFDQWNELIFESSDQHNCWDGTYHGSTVMDDSYFYSMLIETSEHGQQQFTGIITIQK